MDDNGGAKESVQDGAAGPRDKGRDDQGDQCDREGAFKGPVVRAVGLGGGKDGDGVIHGSLDDLCRHVRDNVREVWDDGGGTWTGREDVCSGGPTEEEWSGWEVVNSRLREQITDLLRNDGREME